MHEQDSRRSRPASTTAQAGRSNTSHVRDCLHQAYPVPAAGAFSWSARPTAPGGAIRLPASAPRLPERRWDEDSINLTEVSFAPEAPAESDRRSDDRATLSVYRTATLRWGDAVEALCLIRNISPGGMMAILHRHLPDGEAVTVEIRSGQQTPGHVVWSREEMLGVAFDARIDVLQVLQAPSTGEPGAIQRMPRLNIPGPASVRRDGEAVPVTLLDISQGGAKVESTDLREGDDVILHVAGLDPRRGTVRWQRERRAGIAFMAAVPFDRLARWALERQAEQDAK